jgi:predicted Zn-dependent peptidase
MIERRIEKTILDNGLVVLSEPVEHFRSVSLGIWIRAGSRHERIEENGITHFIEHALFKGTERRSARQIAVEADILGGNLDAFTTREFTGYHIKALDLHLEKSFDILADLVTKPLFDALEMEKERAVILEEIKMVEDTPDEMAHEIFTSTFWPDHPLGRPIEGTAESVQSFTAETLADYYRKVYHPKNIVIAASGNIDHSKLVELSLRYFGYLESDSYLPEERAPRINREMVIRKKRGLEQTHIVLGAACPSLLSSDRYLCGLFNTILGGGLSSRLFQSVREEHGLAYSVYSSINAYRDAGCLLIYMGVSNRHLRKAIDLALGEIRLLKDEPVPLEELQATKDQIKAGILLNLDSVTGRMSSLAQNEILFGRDISIGEIIEEIDKITTEDIRRLGQEIFSGESLGIVVLGGSDRLKLDRKNLAC